MTKIIVQNIAKSYNKRPIINNINMEFCQGEIVGILGPNGAGKTTCFYMIIGITKPSSGKIFINDREITSLPIHKRHSYGIAYLPQESSIFRGLTVEENIMAILEIVEKSKTKRKEKLEELLNEFRIAGLRKQSSISLSGGERRRLEIARLLALNPKFIFLDEPFAGIDPISIDDIKEIITHLKSKNIGIIITDHNVRETLKITDRNYIIYEGKILVEGNEQDVINNQDVQKYYLGSSFT